MKRTNRLKILLYLTFISFNIIPCYGQKTTEFRLHGTIEDGYNGYATLLYDYKLDTIRVNKGHFFIKGDIQSPVDANFHYSNKGFSFYIEPGDLKLSISSSLPKGFKLFGSKTQKESEEFENMTLTNTLLRDSIYKIYKNSKKEGDSLQIQRTGFLLDSLLHERRLNNIKFVKLYPNSFVSLDRLINVSIDDYPIDTIRSWFNHLSDDVKNCAAGKNLNKIIRTNENTAIGLPAPDFTTIGYNEEKISLSSFKGKTIILEFWASWCIPCIQSIPHLKALYHKYREKGLIVIGISIDSNKNNWIAAIKKNQLDIWPQALAIVDIKNARKGQISDSEIISLYPTNSVPRILVINTKGKIIKKWVGYSPEQEKEQDEFFEEYFN